MSQRKKVAIIVPTYNVIAYIEECLQSIEKQTHKNYTVFLMDDGSTDGTKEYLSKWCSEHSKYKLYLLQHGGVSTARNKALDEITKDDSIDYVLFLDSDDMLTSNCLGDSVTACETSNCKVCSFAYIPLYKNTAIPKLSPNKLLLQNKEEIFSYYWNNTPKKFIKVSQTQGRILCNRLYSKDLISDLRFDPSIPLGEDQLFVISILSKANTISVSNHLGYLYRQRLTSASHSATLKRTLSFLLPQFKQLYLSEQLKNEKTESLSIGLLSTIIGLLWDARLCNCVLKDESLSKTINQESLFFLKHAKKMPLKELKRLILLRLPNTIFQKIFNKKSIRIILQRTTIEQPFRIIFKTHKLLN